MTNQKSSHSASGTQALKRRFAILSLTLAASAGLLAGCGGMITNAVDSPAASPEVEGSVFGGQQPIQFATVQLYTAGSSGYSSASTALGNSVLTSVNGNFHMPTFTCTNPAAMTYIVATGGNPGAGVNSAISLMALLGRCDSLPGFIQMNEVTTVASVYALAGFMSDYTHVGTSSTNATGLTNAFSTFNNLVTIGTGTALTVTPAYATETSGTVKTFNSSVPQSEIYTLANILSACVNSTGPSSSPYCGALFGAVTGSPTDTVGAALAIAQNPGYNVSNIYGLSQGAAPFSPVLGAPGPNDWTLGLTFIGGGLGGTTITHDSNPEDMAFDTNGNLFILNQRHNTLTELNNLGVPLSTNTTSTTTGGYPGSAGGLNQPTSLAIDTNNNVWILSPGTLSEFSNGAFVGSGFTGANLGSSANAIAIDGNNNIFTASQATVSEFSSTGSPVTYTSSGLEFPSSIAIDNSGNLFVGDSGNSNLLKFSNALSELDSSGGILSSPTNETAIDPSGRVWIPFTTGVNFVQVFTSAAQSLNKDYTSGSMVDNAGIAIDGLGNAYVSDQGNGNNPNGPALTVFNSSGTTISPSNTGYTGTAGGSYAPVGQGANIVRIDSSGNVWLLDTANSGYVSEFVGLGAPVYTPLALAVKNGAVAARP